MFLYIPYLVLVLSLGRKGRQAEEKSAIESNNSLLISYFLFFFFFFSLDGRGRVYRLLGFGPQAV